MYKNENVELVAAGCANLQHHIRNAAKYGVRVVVAINKFVTDTDAEVWRSTADLREHCHGARLAEKADCVLCW